MGRNRKPLAMQQGNLTKEIKEQKQIEEQIITTGDEDLKKAPSWLIDKIAKDEFKRLVLEFEKVNMVGNLDLNNIACYCNAYANYRKATKELSTQPFMVEKVMPNGIETTIENPLIKIQKNYAEEMRKFSALCGLTIDSRLKYATVKITKDESDINEDFGDI